MLRLSSQETRFYQEAKEDGRQKGRQKTLQEVVANLLNAGMKVDEIAQIAGLSPQQVQELDQR